MVAPTRDRVPRDIGKARISKSGQITIPAEIRRELGLDSGDTVIYSRDDGGKITIRKPRTAAQLAGILGPRPENLDEILEDARHYVREPYRDPELADDDLS